jgi:hypothetical protein
MRAAAGVDRGDHGTVVWVKDPVVPSIGTATGLGFLMGPVFAAATALLSPTIGMENLNDKHEVSAGRFVSVKKESRGMAWDLRIGFGINAIGR